MTSANTSAISASWIVTGSFWAMSSVTGWLVRSEMPRSPVSTPLIQVRY